MFLDAELLILRSDMIRCKPSTVLTNLEILTSRIRCRQAKNSISSGSWSKTQNSGQNRIYPSQCATGYPVPVPVPANPANIFQSGSGSGSGQILAGLAGFLKIIQKFSKMLKM